MPPPPWCGDGCAAARNYRGGYGGGHGGYAPNGDRLVTTLEYLSIDDVACNIFVTTLAIKENQAVMAKVMKEEPRK